MGKLIYGVGLFEEGEYSRYSIINGKKVNTKEYDVWISMLYRCHSKKFKEKHPIYMEADSSYNFKNFQFFARWCNNQKGFNKHNWQLDKDILVKGNKLYSEDTSIFVPRHINSLVVEHYNTQTGINSIVYKQDDCYKLNLAKYTSLVFSNLDSALQAYKLIKESHIKLQAKLHKDELSEIAYNGLMNFELTLRK